MSYNLTENQKELLRWIVTSIKADLLSEEFSVNWEVGGRGFSLTGFRGEEESIPDISQGILDALVASDLLLIEPRYMRGGDGQPFEYERRCVVLGKAFDAVESDFSASDTSFVTYLTPLADITNLDEEIKIRCLPILGAGGTDPKLWDSAVRTSVVILEERMRNVGKISDSSRGGRDLVNDVFGQQGTLASKFNIDSERQGFRDLFAGAIGAFRNPYSHRLVDPSPEDGGAYLLFVNLLLRMLEDLR